jgi:hypothetical protein
MNGDIAKEWNRIISRYLEKVRAIKTTTFIQY